jgi:hypothetical protein
LFYGWYFVFLGVFSFWPNNLLFIGHQTMDKVQKYASTTAACLPISKPGFVSYYTFSYQRENNKLQSPNFTANRRKSVLYTGTFEPVDGFS